MALSSRRPSAAKSGFTLIELLVVIAIIAILAAILFPVFAQAREKARAASCLSNEKQMGLALLSYAEDSDGGMPTWDEYWYCQYVACPGGAGSDGPSRMWDAKLYPYVKNGSAPTANANPAGGVWQCPDSSGTSAQRSYGVSMGFTYDTDAHSIYYYRYLNDADIEKAAQTVFVGDSGYDGRLSLNYGNYTYSGYNAHFITKPADQYIDDATYRHGGGANYVFCDGHAKWFVAESLYPHPSPPSTTYSTALVAQTKCVWATWFAAKANERQNKASEASTGGYPCTD